MKISKNDHKYSFQIWNLVFVTLIREMNVDVENFVIDSVEVFSSCVFVLHDEKNTKN